MLVCQCQEELHHILQWGQEVAVHQPPRGPSNLKGPRPLVALLLQRHRIEVVGPRPTSDLTYLKNEQTRKCVFDMYFCTTYYIFYFIIHFKLSKNDLKIVILHAVWSWTFKCDVMIACPKKNRNAKKRTLFSSLLILDLKIVIVSVGGPFNRIACFRFWEV